MLDEFVHNRNIRRVPPTDEFERLVFCQDLLLTIEVEVKLRLRHVSRYRACVQA